MTSIKLRPANTSDIESIYTVFSLTHQIHRDSHPEIFQAFTYPKSAKNYYLESIQSQDRTIFVAEDNGKIIGVLLCAIQSTPDKPILVPRTYGCIENITVIPSYQGKGIGKKLMLQAHEWARSQGATMMELTVWEFNQPAQHFYQKLDYRTTKRRLIKDLE